MTQRIVLNPVSRLLSSFITRFFAYFLSAEFDEAAELLSADPGASTLAMPASPAVPGVQDVRLDLSDNEEGQEESSEVCEGIATVTGCFRKAKAKKMFIIAASRRTENNQQLLDL